MSSAQTRTVTVKVRMTPEERDRLELAAKHQGLTMSGFLRGLSAQAVRRAIRAGAVKPA